MPSPDWLTWGFWSKDTQSLNHLAVIVAGMIGIPLLAIRTFAANRSARAALEQAKAANQSAAAAFEQAKTAAERHEEQTRADRERRITESFAKAGEQLGSDKLETRLVGIYTLERISGESEHEYWPIMETRTAFVRERAPWPPRQAVINPFVELQSSSAVEESRPVEQADKESAPTEEPKDAPEQTGARARPTTDIQAVLTVLGRRNETARQQDKGRRLDLAATDLRGANLVEAHLEGANLVEAHLEGADLGGAHLEGADLGGAHLEGASLGKAHLEGAYLRGAIGLTQGQLDVAFGDDRTELPEGLTRPGHWPAATAEDQPDEQDNPRQHP